ncbi:MAG: polysaccharide biosynthesis tyrosine autokinase [Caldilineaceae bacterium]
MELFTYWKMIRKRLWILLFLLVIAAAAAGYSVQRQPLLYRTTTTLFITPTVVGSVLPQEIVGSVAPLANNYTELMRTLSFAKLVAQELNRGLTETEILEAISATYVRDTQIFRITVTFTDPQIAQALANATARMLIEANAERQRAQQEALFKAQRTPEKIAERNRVLALEAALHDELSYYDDLILEVEGQIQVLEQGPQSETQTQRILTLREELVSYRTERVNVLSSLAQTQGTLAATSEEPISDVDTAVVIEEAPLPQEALPRNLIQPILAALAAAIALGIALAWLLDALDHTVKSPKELDAHYGIPTQAAIGIAQGSRKLAESHRSLTVLHAPHSPIAEAFRSLRTAVRIADATLPVHSLLVTSAISGEGKTFIAANLALSLAQEGKQVILVDLDLRRPALHKIFEMRQNLGVAELVAAQHYTLPQLLQRTLVPNLQLLTSGALALNPAELLGSARTTTILTELAKLADIVVYDAPPATIVTDALLIAPQVDGVLQVIRAGAARIDQIAHGKTLLERAGARIIGPVLNCVAKQDLDYYASAYAYNSAARPHQEPPPPTVGYDPIYVLRRPQTNGVPPVQETALGKWNLPRDE